MVNKNLIEEAVIQEKEKRTKELKSVVKGYILFFQYDEESGNNCGEITIPLDDDSITISIKYDPSINYSNKFFEDEILSKYIKSTVEDKPIPLYEKSSTGEVKDIIDKRRDEMSLVEKFSFDVNYVISNMKRRILKYK